MTKPIILIVIDGWGFSKEKIGNAILSAKTPTFDKLKKEYPFFLLQASGLAVGLPPLKEGNSEVGHLVLGSGRIVPQYLTKIDEAIKDKTLFENKIFSDLIGYVKSKNSKLHLIGLLTSGTVHASLEHLLAIINFLQQKEELPKVNIHLFTDGRDSGKKESVSLLKIVNETIKDSNKFKVCSLIGRDFAMDKKEGWELTKKSYDLLINGSGNRVENLEESLKKYHFQEITDEIIPPTILEEDCLIKDGDGVFFFNFREDGMSQLIRAFAEENFNYFETKKLNLFLVTMTNYGKNLKSKHLFDREEIKNTLGEVLQNNNKTQLRIAEKIKSAHITYFFNGLKEEPFLNEKDIFIESVKDPENNPRMSLDGIKKALFDELKKNKYDFILVNFANPDILSHTGNFQATVKGIEAIDQTVEEIYNKLKDEAIIIIISDHGNAERLTYSTTGEIETKHNINPVPLYLVAEEFKKEKSPYHIIQEEKEINGLLSDIAPTILALMGIEKPQEMTGINLIQEI